MDYEDFNNSICRICMEENVVLDWCNTLVEHGDVTYKDCYYKYTQLKCHESDPFSTMLCQNCSNGLENMHTLILSALDSYNFLLNVNSADSDNDVEDEENVILEETIIEEDVSCNSTDFETVLVNNTDSESLEYFEFETCNEEFIEEVSLVKTKVDHTFEILAREQKSNIINNSPKEGTINNKISSARKGTSTTSINITPRRELNTLKSDKSKAMGIANSGRQPKSSKAKSKFNSQNTPSMCCICSKILHNKYALRKHEKTHADNRERKAACPICGVKFFEEAHVKNHMHIHKENRVKKHKCEFCGKDFFEKGVLNVHRRMHLGQMIPCTLCPKECFSQLDLEIHMNSHSASVINGNYRKRPRYWVQCKYCDKKILSTSYKAHTAIHLNEPLMKCSICDKEFYRRSCCTQHLKSIHKKTTDELNDFIISYSKGRLSHLLLEQTANIVAKDY